MQSKNKTEPLFIQFANFHFSTRTLEEFINLLKGEGIEIPLKEIFLYYRTEGEEYSGGPQNNLTEPEKEKISTDLESVRRQFRDILMALTEEENFDWCLERINFLCSEVPIEFARHKKDMRKLELLNPSFEKVHKIGWGDFVTTIMALDLGRYLLSNPINKIRLCKRESCQNFFAERGLKAKFCSDHCRQLYHHIVLRDKHYYRDHMREYRSQGKH